MMIEQIWMLYTRTCRNSQSLLVVGIDPNVSKGLDHSAVKISKGTLQVNLSRELSLLPFNKGVWIDGHGN